MSKPCACVVKSIYNPNISLAGFSHKLREVSVGEIVERESSIPDGTRFICVGVESTPVQWTPTVGSPVDPFGRWTRPFLVGPIRNPLYPPRHKQFHFEKMGMLASRGETHGRKDCSNGSTRISIGPFHSFPDELKWLMMEGANLSGHLAVCLGEAVDGVRSTWLGGSGEKPTFGPRPHWSSLDAPRQRSEGSFRCRSSGRGAGSENRL